MASEATTRSIIQPVWGLARRKISTEMLDRAETLVENLDDIADVLDKLTEKYEKETSHGAHFVTKHEESEGSKDDEKFERPGTTLKDTAGFQGEQANARLFLKLKTGLDASRKLIECLRTEKRRMMKRELSVECRLGEIQDYKEHMKHDLTSMNETIDLLSFRLRQLEDQLVEQEEHIETLEAENLKHQENLEMYQSTISDLRSDNDILLEQTVSLRRERTNTNIMLENKDLLYKIEMLVVENAKLKEMVRRYNEDEIQSVSSEGDLGQSRDHCDDGKNNNNANYSAQISMTSREESESFM